MDTTVESETTSQVGDDFWGDNNNGWGDDNEGVEEKTEHDNAVEGEKNVQDVFEGGGASSLSSDDDGMVGSIGKKGPCEDESARHASIVSRVDDKAGEEASSADASSLVDANAECQCGICFETALESDMPLRRCCSSCRGGSGWFHVECILNYAKQKPMQYYMECAHHPLRECPTCRQPYGFDLARDLAKAGDSLILPDDVTNIEHINTTKTADHDVAEEAVPTSSMTTAQDDG